MSVSSALIQQYLVVSSSLWKHSLCSALVCYNVSEYQLPITILPFFYLTTEIKKNLIRMSILSLQSIKSNPSLFTKTEESEPSTKLNQSTEFSL